MVRVTNPQRGSIHFFEAQGLDGAIGLNPKFVGKLLERLGAAYLAGTELDRHDIRSTAEARYALIGDDLDLLEVTYRFNPDKGASISAAGSLREVEDLNNLLTKYSEFRLDKEQPHFLPQVESQRKRDEYDLFE